MEVDPGTLVTSRADFRDASGALALPSSVTFISRNPSGVYATQALGSGVTLVSSGYEAPLLVSMPGEWDYRFVATGGVIVTAAGQHRGRPTRF